MNAGLIRKFLVKRYIIFTCIAVFCVNISGSLVQTLKESAGGTSLKRIEINAAKDDANISPVLKYKDIQLLKSRYDNCQVSFSSEITSVLTCANKSFKVRNVLCDSGSFEFLNIKMVAGNFFQDKDDQFGLNSVIISDKLCASLFSSYDTLGYKVKISGQIYVIAGIYKTDGSVLSFLGSDGEDRVYVPYKSVRDYGGIAVQSVIIKGESLNTDRFRIEKLEQVLNDSLNTPANGCRIIDFYVKDAVISQTRDIFVFLIFLISFFISLKLGYRLLRRYANILMTRCREEYIREVIKSQIQVIIKMAVIIVFYATAGFLVIKYTLPDIYIDPKYIPYDNIFDIKFYIDSIKAALISHNRSLGCNPSQSELVFSSSMGLNIIALSISSVFFILSVGSVRLFSILGIKAAELVKYFILASLIGNTLTIACTMAFSLSPGISVIPASVMLIFHVCYLLCISKCDGIIANKAQNESGISY